MPTRPASIAIALLAGAMLTGFLAMPLKAQTPAAPDENAAPGLRPGLTLDEGASPVDTASDAPEVAPEADAASTPVEDGETGGNTADLEQVEASLTISQERIETLKAEIAAMEGDRTQQSAALIASAQRVKLAEIEVADVEDRLADLIVRELEIRGRLDGADAQISDVLAALERISLNPPPALIVDPSDALGSARGAMLMAAVVPQLRDRADAVAQDLKTLKAIKQSAMDEEATLRANHDVLEEEQLRIATLISARRQGITRMSAALEAEEEAAMALAERAGTLRELVAALSERAAAGATSAPPTGRDETLPVLSSDAIRLAFADPARTTPGVPFPLARGYLVMPANGEIVVEYGANDRKGGIAQGQSIITRPDAQVLAPADGWVLYKGPYLNYGQIIILNTGGGYTALLAGLGAISVDVGQFVLMGEPLGTMGSHTIGRTVTTSAGNTQPTLYIEFRQNNEPFNPVGWWAHNEQTG